MFGGNYDKCLGKGLRANVCHFAFGFCHYYFFTSYEFQFGGPSGNQPAFSFLLLKYYFKPTNFARNLVTEEIQTI
jgi:hypothetical protein